jgi:hypothetical protein
MATSSSTNRRKLPAGEQSTASRRGQSVIDFYFDDESMKILAQSDEFVNREGI